MTKFTHIELEPITHDEVECSECKEKDETIKTLQQSIISACQRVGTAYGKYPVNASELADIIIKLGE